ncbi:MAG: WG repeat-containing protein [Breznakibacter sp.]
MKRFALLLVSALFCMASWSQALVDSLLQQYDKYWEISPGIYRVMKNGLVGVAGHQGIVVPVEYQHVWNLSDKDYFRVMRNGKTGLFHVTKGIIIPAEYDQIWDFSDGKLRVLKNGKLGLIGPTGQVLVPCQYQQIWDFRDGIAKVIRDGKLGYVNDSGQEVIPCIYQQISIFENGTAKVVRDGKFGFVDLNGNEIVPCDYQQISDFVEGKARVVKNGKIGFIDKVGQEIIPPIFSQIWEFENDRAKAVLDGKMVTIDQRGNVLSVDESAVIPPALPIAPVSDVPLTQPLKAEVPPQSTDSAKTLRLGNKVFVITNQGDEKAIEMTSKNDWGKRDRSKRKFKGHYQGVDLYYNSFLNKNGGTTLPDGYDFLDLNGSKSIGVGVNLLQENISLSRRGNIGLVTGLGIDFNNYRFDSQNKLVVNEQGKIDHELLTDPVKKNKLTSIYLSIPLSLEFQIPASTRKDPIFLSGGVVGGYKLRSYTKIVYNGGDKDKTRGDYNLSDLRLGTTVRLGYKFINLNGLYYFTPLFDKTGDPKLYPYSIGISFYPDWM